LLKAPERFNISLRSADDGDGALPIGCGGGASGVGGASPMGCSSCGGTTCGCGALPMRCGGGGVDGGWGQWRGALSIGCGGGPTSATTEALSQGGDALADEASQGGAASSDEAFL
jgi:hypothetical protein